LGGTARVRRAVGLYLGGAAASTEPRLHRVSALRVTIPAAPDERVFHLLPVSLLT
jgi:hypothetical protein